MATIVHSVPQLNPRVCSPLLPSSSSQTSLPATLLAPIANHVPIACSKPTPPKAAPVQSTKLLAPTQPQPHAPLPAFCPLGATSCNDYDDTAAAPSPPGVSLSPKQVRDFIEDGYLLLWPSVPGGDLFHQRAWKHGHKLVDVGEVGNNLLCEDVAPEGVLDGVLDAPEIVGALTAVLGEDYALIGSRHCHLSKPGSAGQPLHQDDFYGFDRFRHMVPKEVMIFYYPQAVTDLMGPTAVVPGSQYSRRQQKSPAPGQFVPSGSEHQPERLLTLDRPGAVMMMHWNLWHRATAQRGGDAVPIRFAYKFQFRRTRPLRPAPAALACARSMGNPFAQREGSPIEAFGHKTACFRTTTPRTTEGCSDPPGSNHRRICLAVWDALCGDDTTRHPEVEGCVRRHPHRDASLAVAAGMWPAQEAFAELARVLCTTPGDGEGDLMLYDEVPDAKMEAASALVHCGAQATDSVNSSRRAWASHAVKEALRGELRNTPHLGKPLLPTHAWHADWRLEVISAFPALFSPADTLLLLVPLIGSWQAGRVQLHAMASIFDAGIRCGAPNCAEWRDAAEKTRLEPELLACIAWWQSWRARTLAQAAISASISPWHQRVAGPGARPGEDGGGRYVLGEALRCVARFSSPFVARESARIIGVPDRADLFSGPGWRHRFARYVERRRRCPITSKGSPF